MPDYADQYADALHRYAATPAVPQYHVTLRTKEGRTVGKLVTTTRTPDAIREHYRGQGHFPLTVKPVLPATVLARPPENPFAGLTKPRPAPKPLSPVAAKAAAAWKVLKTGAATFKQGFKEGYAGPPPPPTPAPPTSNPAKAPLLRGVSPSYKAAPAPSAAIRGADRPPPMPAPVEREGGLKHFTVTVQGRTGSSTVTLTGLDEASVAKDAERALGGKVVSVERA